MTRRVSSHATGVTHYTVGVIQIYSVTERKGIAEDFCESRSCVTWNATHMTLPIPEIPGKLKSVSFRNRCVARSQLCKNGVITEVPRGPRLHLSKTLLKLSFSEKCLPYQFLSSFKLFTASGEILSLVVYPESSQVMTYGDKDCPVGSYLCQPIYLERGVFLNRTDPNIKLVLEDGWTSTH
ncbi:LOW QUALITY PROTEIN: zona pellucida sperm-binding protein 2 [Rhynchonycteris naso]